MSPTNRESARVQRRKEPRQDRAKNTVEKLLDVTEQLLEEIGLDGVTTILIAERAGLSVGTLYEYFPNKHSILFALASRWIEMLRSVLAANEVDQRGFVSWAHWYESYVTAMFAIYAQERGLVRYYDILVSVPDLRDLDMQIDAVVMSYLKRSIATFFPATDKEALAILARMMITTIHNTLRFAVNMPPSSKKKMMGNLHFVMQTLILKTVH